MKKMNDEKIIFIEKIDFLEHKYPFNEKMRFSSWVKKDYLMPSILLKKHNKNTDNILFEIIILDSINNINKELVGGKLYFGTPTKVVGFGFIKNITKTK